MSHPVDGQVLSTADPKYFYGFLGKSVEFSHLDILISYHLHIQFLNKIKIVIKKNLSTFPFFF